MVSTGNNTANDALRSHVDTSRIIIIENQDTCEWGFYSAYITYMNV